MGAYQQVVAEALDVLDQSVGGRPRQNVGLCHDISQSIRKARQFLPTPGHEFVLKVLAQSAACVRGRRHDIDDSKWRTTLARDLCRALECRLQLGLSKEVGAFVAGASLASTPYREAIGSRLITVRDFLLLFFFIDLGARLDLSLLGATFGEAMIFEAAVRYERERAGLGFRFEAQANRVFARLLENPFQFPLLNKALGERSFNGKDVFSRGPYALR